MERKGCESIIHDHDSDLWVTMVGWVALLDSDWGDFKGWRAIEISSYIEYEVSDEKNLAIHGTLEMDK